ncbi:hypothetical protein Phi19:1_gp089 [Cellulophaga phage phi19:1]|uniref:Uncharacterized protein n=1 Tax=Cellulophaga phage phi19:1 TaxID=1327970 RepID=R9ZW07_9CAUD|nr:hypothetical protein Phi19:1_gp089 [Cellulophaga phage phi19:1]AGO47379.1 hypothetical protein Phi19:1_gp089 [Cellulophaga phage phi19:1]
MAKKKIEKEPVKEVKKELVYGKYSSTATIEVEYIKDFGRDKKGDKAILHPCTAELLRYNGVIK